MEGGSWRGGGCFPSAEGLTQTSSWQFYEMLDIWTARNNLTLSITGHGVMPSTVCSVEDVLDMGYVIAGEKVTSTFKVNPSVLNREALQRVL